MFVYVGCYTQGDSPGIHTCRYDAVTGTVTPAGLTAAGRNATFLAVHPTEPWLYAVSEVGEVDGKKVGAVLAYRRDLASGALTALNYETCGGPGPCHLVVDRTGKFVLVANYSGGSVALLPLQSDGRVGALGSFYQHSGTGPNAKRQERPHAHSVNLDAANRFAFVADLGIDQLVVYQLDAAAGKLQPHDPPFAAVHPGAGPRHFTFHPSGRYAYAINELDSTMTAFAYAAAAGKLTTIQTITTLPAGWSGTNWPADVHLDAAGRFLYGSNRGHDSLVIYEVNPADGQLTLVGHESVQGKNPRNFALSPDGQFVLVANQDTGNIVTFRRDATTGKLTGVGNLDGFTKPVCVMFAP
ncbi:MAG: lactonase family protein [Fimbriimonadaceae bacterium]|nr:lactonase family protein [Fimbriimonadaceae bacterium]